MHARKRSAPRRRALCLKPVLGTSLVLLLVLAVSGCASRPGGKAAHAPSAGAEGADRSPVTDAGRVPGGAPAVEAPAPESDPSPRQSGSEEGGNAAPGSLPVPGSSKSPAPSFAQEPPVARPGPAGAGEPARPASPPDAGEGAPPATAGPSPERAPDLIGALEHGAPRVRSLGPSAWRLDGAGGVLGWWPSPRGSRLAITFEAPVPLPGGEDVRAVGLGVLDLGPEGPVAGPVRPLAAALAYGYGPAAPGEAAPALTLTPVGWLDEDRIVVLEPAGGVAPGTRPPDAVPGGLPVFPWPPDRWPPGTAIASAGTRPPVGLAAAVPGGTGLPPPEQGGQGGDGEREFYELPGLSVVEVNVSTGALRPLAWVPLDGFGDVLGRVWLTADHQALFLVQGTGLVRADLGSGTVRRLDVSLPPGKYTGIPEVMPIGDGWRLLYGMQSLGAVHHLNLRTGADSVVTPEGVVLPTFHTPVPDPAGERFAYLVAEPDRPYVRFEGDDGDFVLANALYIMDTKGQRLTRAVFPGQALVREVSWAPDGGLLVALGAGASGQEDAYRGGASWTLRGGPLYLVDPGGKVEVLWDNPERRLLSIAWVAPRWLVLYDQGTGEPTADARAPLFLRVTPGATPVPVPAELRGREFPVSFLTRGSWVVGQGADNRLYRFLPGAARAERIEPQVRGWILDWVSPGPWIVLKLQTEDAGPQAGRQVVLEGRRFPDD